MRHREIEPIELRHEQRGARAWSGRNAFDQSIVVGVGLVEHRDEPFPARDVDAMRRGVQEQIIRVADDIGRGDELSRRRVVDQKPGGVATADKQSMMRLIESHWIVRARLRHRPCRHD